MYHFSESRKNRSIVKLSVFMNITTNKKIILISISPVTSVNNNFAHFLITQKVWENFRKSSHGHYLPASSVLLIFALILLINKVINTFIIAEYHVKAIIKLK